MKYVIDTDPGVDDILALTVGIRELDVLLLSVVGGNISLPYATQNALDYVAYLGRKTKVCSGSDSSINGTKFISENWLFGENGIADHKLEKSDLEAEKADVADVLFKTIMEAEEKVSIIAIAPLTNIARLIQAYPSVRENLDEILIMGGSTNGLGNVTETAEYNFYSDPEAVKIVFESGIKIKLFPLDFTRTHTLSEEEINYLGKNCGDTGKTLYSVISAATKNFKKMHKQNQKKSFALHDLFVAMYAVDSSLFKTKQAEFSVDIEGNRGQTFCKFDGIKTSHIEVICDVNREKFIKKLFDIVGNN